MQYTHTLLPGLFDNCLPSKGLGWSIGIASAVPDNRKDGRLYFRLRTDRAREESVLWVPSRLIPGEWLHMAVTYDGLRTKIYLNGAKVAVSTGQIGKVFTTVFRRCKDFIIGGSLNEKTSYRGGMGALRLWSKALKHHEITAKMFDFSMEDLPGNLVFEDYFRDKAMWHTIGQKSPTHTKMSANPNTHDVALSAPPCGQTVCDDPVVLNAYLENERLREMKTIRYSVINIVGDGGASSTVTSEQLSLQDTAIRSMFKPYNINWQMKEVRVENDTLMEKTVLFGCDPVKVGDGYCNSECLHVHTAWDGGDCDHHPVHCPQDDIGDGFCDSECNNGYFYWDGGDCCYEHSQHCYDPYSPHRYEHVHV